MASRVKYLFLSATPCIEAKLPPQAIVIMKTLEGMGKDGKHEEVTRDALCEILNKPDGDKPNMLNARQPVERVVAFYQKRLQEYKMIDIIKVVAEKKEKPAKTSGKAKVPDADPEATKASMKV